jgi:hypothetical protein
MKKQWLWGILLVPLLISCLDFDLPRVNGMWQLKTIQDENANVQVVDTIYYSFQRQAIFSYTILNGDISKPYSTVVIHGYVDFPDQDKLHIQIDKLIAPGYLAYLEDKILWNGMETDYDIVKLNSKEMILGQNGKLYKFIKF